MNVFETIKRNRRIVIIGAGSVYAITAVALAAGFTSNGIDGYQAIALAVGFTLPATLALLSLNRRPSLLTAAWMAALASAVIVIELSPVWIVIAVAWGIASRSRPRPAPDARWMTWGRPLLAVATVVPVFVLFMHLDPVCTTTYSDGRTEVVDASTRGFQSGWQFPGSTYSGGIQSSTQAVDGSAVAGPDLVSEQCDSDTVVWWEALISVATSASILGWASRWPTSNQLTSDRVGAAV